MIVITGATGQTGAKIADILLEKGKSIRVLGRSKEKLLKFKENGAELRVGRQENASFLTEAFIGAKVAYVLIPPKIDARDIRKYYNSISDSIVSAVANSGLKKLVFLSSLGAEQESGTGPIIGLHDAEIKLSSIQHVDLAILRPGYFMENLLWNIPLIKNQHINGDTALPDTNIPMIFTRDIAENAAELLINPSFEGRIIVDLFGEKITPREATNIIGETIGEPDLPYVRFSDKEALRGMQAMGLSESVAGSYVELSHGFDAGRVHATQIDPDTPSAPTRFGNFVEEVFKPAYDHA